MALARKLLGGGGDDVVGSDASLGDVREWGLQMEGFEECAIW